jgi:hypothetical protein
MSPWQCVRLTSYRTRLRNRACLCCHSYFKLPETVWISGPYPPAQAETRLALAGRKSPGSFILAYRGARWVSACIFYCL